MLRNVFFLGLILALGNLFAEPYIAVRTGFKCSQCHVNRTGGGKRTEYGEVYTQYKLLMASPLIDTNMNSFDPKLNKSISIGANFRIEQSYLQKYTTKVVNPTDTPITTASERWDAGIFAEKNLYVEMDLIKDRLKLYYDLDMSNGGFRELWSMITLPANGYVKFGQMLLPYGYRLMDNAAFVRIVPDYTYSKTTLAYEMGFEPGPLSLVTNITQTQSVTVGSLIFRDLPVIRTIRVGGSYSYELTKKLKNTNGSYGAFAGTTLGMFTFLGERDYTKVDSVNKVEDYFETDFLPMQGMNFKFTYESYWHDTSIQQSLNNQTRMTFGFEPFIMQYMQVGLYYRINKWLPQTTNNNQDQILGRLHVFF